MNQEIQSIIRHLREVTSGEPWFGRAVFQLLEEVDPATAYTKPGHAPHSLAELLYHMITWAAFAQKRIEGEKEKDLRHFEQLDWRKLDPAVDTWDKGRMELQDIFASIIRLLGDKEDSFLDEKVDYREYDFRFLLQGVTEHTIYHLGQIAYLHKSLG